MTKPLKHAVIFANPGPRSLTRSIAHGYAESCHALGHTTVIRDLYAMGFDPRLPAHEVPGTEGFHVAGDVQAERLLLQDCDVYVLVYPFWLNAQPAMLKGYLERVFGFGFAYGGGGHSGNPLLTGKSLLSFTTSGAPTEWVQKTGALQALQTLFDRYFASLCGLTLVEHVHFGSIRAGASDTFIAARLADVTRTVNAHFRKRR